jgi:hypothetical protein
MHDKVTFSPLHYRRFPHFSWGAMTGHPSCILTIVTFHISVGLTCCPSPTSSIVACRISMLQLLLRWLIGGGQRLTHSTCRATRWRWPSRTWLWSLVCRLEDRLSLTFMTLLVGIEGSLTFLAGTHWTDQSVGMTVRLEFISVGCIRSSNTARGCRRCYNVLLRESLGVAHVWNCVIFICHRGDMVSWMYIPYLMD